MPKQFQFREEAGWSHADEVLLCLDTESWRIERPVLDKEKCNYCGLCALFCPIQCMVNKEDHFEANLKFCKGCGVCAYECPRKAITMQVEGDF